MSSTSFSELPIELLSVIFQFIVKPSHFTTLCLVNTSFRDLAVPLLYESAYVYPWHNESKLKVVQLFRTLRRNATLARYVKKLVIKDFPKSLATAQLEEIWTICAAGLRNCVNLVHCTWTRDGSLNDAILEALLSCLNLREVEINGHHDGQYNPSLLCRFTGLNKITLIMPSGLVIQHLPFWIKETGPTLQYLSLICKASSLITDSLLKIIAPNLPFLEHFSLLGCPKVTHEGILAILSQNKCVIQGLGLEGLSPNFDMTKFSFAGQTSTLSQLRSLTITVQRPLEIWTRSVQKLMENVPLELFQVYSPGGEDVSILPDDFCSELVSRHHGRLRRFSVHRMRVSFGAVEKICSQCPNLEQLFVVMRRQEMRLLGPVLAKAHKLRSVHINFPLDAAIGVTRAEILEDVQAILQECTETPIIQFGCNTRVWQIERAVRREEIGEFSSEIRLVKYERPEVPEQFLVLRA
ncbi:hypothetical protein NEOLEDRAFT_1155981 [Neolentinus lepideus HHB14362 ss-1]|uniref:F-box domain-containing protein n=1 Tax=Neolentinus lepideus HHB14362 ss-1 TaxID=1314782 RepID=A0A165T4Q0_9AGAM|nr:hypothetical protein NEOLEDRAFT_1155981 [Neolentinus lepideus HHB14362 ss-1]